MFVNKAIMRIYHCYKCISYLERYGIGFFSLYEKLCEIYIRTGELVLLDSTDKSTRTVLNTAIKFLEKKQFVLTTEAVEINNKFIKLKPIGHLMTDENTHSFCPLHCKENIIHDDI